MSTDTKQQPQQHFVDRKANEEKDAHRNNKADFDAFSEEYLRKYYPFVDPEHIQQILKYYPKSQKELVITICLAFLSVICITYFLIALYRCMCSRKYSKWRASWSKQAKKGKTNNYIKMIKDSLPIVLRGHMQVRNFCALLIIILFCSFCSFKSQVNSYGRGGTVSSPKHTFSWASLTKQLTSTSCTYFCL